MTDRIKQLGQYFTPDFVASFMVSLSTRPKDVPALEPSCGKGVFLDALAQAGYHNVTGLEIDESLLDGIRHARNESFISATFPHQFGLIIGNPPYVRWKNMVQDQKDELSANPLWQRYFNSLSDYLYIFILKSVELLEDEGELIFITPEYWLNTLHARSLRNYLLAHGYVKEIYHFSETPIFTHVASSIIIFKYIKSTRKAEAATVYRYSSKKRLTPSDLQDIDGSEAWSHFSVPPFARNESWILAPDTVQQELAAYERTCRMRITDMQRPVLIPETDVSYVRLGDIATIANGLVSGLDKAFQLPDNVQLNEKEQVATLNVIKAKDMQSYIHGRPRRYIFLNDVPLSEAELICDYPAFFQQLQEYKDGLLKRYSYNRDIHYWEWAFLRSMQRFRQPTQKILVPCKERITSKDRLRFCLAEPNEYPTQDMTAVYLHPAIRESIYYILGLLNSRVTYDWVRYKGVLKGGIAEFSERPLSMIPIRLIDWSDAQDVAHHERITRAVQDYMAGTGTIEAIDILVSDLLLR